MGTVSKFRSRIAALLLLAGSAAGCVAPTEREARDTEDAPTAQAGLGSQASALSEFAALNEWVAVGGCDGCVVNAATSFSMKNTHINKYIHYGRRTWGINLEWSTNPRQEVRFAKVLNHEPVRDGRPIRYGDTVTWWFFRHGYVKYEERAVGINLGWGRAKEEWVVEGGPVGEPLRYGQRFGLKNTRHRDHVVYCERPRGHGINLKWNRGCDYRTYAERQQNRTHDTNANMLLQPPPLEVPFYYASTFNPTTGSERIQSIHFSTAFPPVKLVKPGYSTQQCADPNAVVLVHGEMTAAQKVAVWGRDVTQLNRGEALSFVGCSTWGGPTPLQYLPVSVRWQAISSLVGDQDKLAEGEDEAVALLPAEPDESVLSDESFSDVESLDGDVGDLEEVELAEDELVAEGCKLGACDEITLPNKPKFPKLPPVDCIRAEDCPVVIDDPAPDQGSEM